MKKTRRILTVILAVIMLLSIVPGVSASAMTQSAFNSKVSSFKSTQYSNNSTYKNNPSKTGGYQCFGFANEMALYVFGSYPTNSMSASSVNSNWTRTYGGSGVDKLALGDIVRYACHSIFITGISGNTVYYAQANVPSGTNKVTYNNTISKSSLRSKVESKLTHSGATTKGWVAHCKNGVTGSTSTTPTVTSFNVNFRMKSGAYTNAYSAVNGSKVGRVYPNDICTIKTIYSNGWMKLVCPWNNSGNKTVYVKITEFKFKATKYINAYNGVNGSYVGRVYPNDLVSVQEIYSSGWMKCSCPWNGKGNKIIYIKTSQIY